jgi:hypothetical protein
MNPISIASVAVGLIAAYCATGASAASAPFDFETLKGRPNLQQTPIGSSGQWSLEKLLALSQKEGVELWRSLPAVPLKEMNGHYLGVAPFADNVAKQKEFANAMRDENAKSGYWLGKGFKPVTETTGEGYNRYRLPGGKIVYKGRMGTRIGKSLVDGKPAYIIDYSVFDKSITSIDELRKLDDFIYLGIATTDAGDGKRSKPFFWLLTGPTDRWVGPDEN